MFATRFFIILAFAVAGTILVSLASRKADRRRVPAVVRPQSRHRPNRPSMPEQAAAVGDLWFQTASRMVWGLILVSLSLVGTLATL